MGDSGGLEVHMERDGRAIDTGVRLQAVDARDAQLLDATNRKFEFRLGECRVFLELDRGDEVPVLLVGAFERTSFRKNRKAYLTTAPDEPEQERPKVRVRLLDVRTKPVKQLVDVTLEHTGLDGIDEAVGSTGLLTSDGALRGHYSFLSCKLGNSHRRYESLLIGHVIEVDRL